jgi:hypothetical protein
MYNKATIFSKFIGYKLLNLIKNGLCLNNKSFKQKKLLFLKFLNFSQCV